MEELEALDFTPEEETTAEEAEPTEEAPAEEPETTEAPAEEAHEEQPQETFEIEHGGETKKLTREEMNALAKKGMEYDTLKAENARNAGSVRVLERLAKQSNQSVEEYLKTVSDRLEKADEAQRLKDLMQTHGIDEKTARIIDGINREHRKKEENYGAVNDRLNELEAERGAREIWTNFTREHTEYKTYAELPEEVRLAVRTGKSLEDAYNAYEVKHLKEQIKKGEQNEKNRKNAPGSAKDMGAEDFEKDPFMKGFLGNF